MSSYVVSDCIICPTNKLRKTVLIREPKQWISKSKKTQLHIFWNEAN